MAIKTIKLITFNYMPLVADRRIDMFWTLFLPGLVWMLVGFLKEDSSAITNAHVLIVGALIVSQFN